MQSDLELVTSLGRTIIDGETYDVFAQACASYDAASGRLSIEMDSYLRPEASARLSERIVPDWLPKPQVDREHVDPDEASDLAKEVFHRWCGKVEKSVPHLKS